MVSSGAQGAVVARRWILEVGLVEEGSHGVRRPVGDC